MKIVSMKYTPAVAKEETDEMASPSARQYPYGLCLSLDDECLKKLGISSLDELSVGTAVQLMGVGKVTGTREAEYEDGEGPEMSLDIQITALGLQQGKASKTPGEALYGSDD